MFSPITYLNLTISLPSFADEEPGILFKDKLYHTSLQEVFKI